MNASFARPISLLQSVTFLRFCTALILLKTLWGIWEYKDITFGDTSYYFETAFAFAKDGSNIFAWSPAYTSFLGFLYDVLRDVHLVVILHRIIIVALITFLLFEISQRVLSPAMGFLITAWWLLLPINHNSLYEVHIFAFVPLLFTVLISVLVTGHWGRAMTMASLVLTTVLVRNEYLIAIGLLGLCCLWVDFILPFWHRNTLSSRWALLRPLWAYAICGMVSVVIILGVYERSMYKYPVLHAYSQGKHTLNMAQIFTYSHQQQTGDASVSPWTEYHDFMIRTFGKAEPSMAEAFRANPLEVTKHFLWNLRLTPSGFQLALFNTRFGMQDPDYIESPRSPVLAGILSLCLIAVWGFGVYSYWSMRDEKDRQLFHKTLWTWITLATMAATTLVVIIMQRPRPSYMFVLSFVLMLLTGAAIIFFLRRFRMENLFNRFFPWLAIALVLLFPSYWMAYGQIPRPRPYLAQVRLLEKSGLKPDPDQKLGVFGYAFEVSVYAWQEPEAVYMDGILANANDLPAFNRALDENQIRYILISDSMYKKVLEKLGLDGTEIEDWNLMAEISDIYDTFYLLDRKSKSLTPPSFQLE